MSPSLRKQHICVIGAGYVGLPTAAVLSHFGHNVTVYDRDPSIVAAIRSGRTATVEVGLSELLREGIDAGRLRPCDTLEEAMVDVDFVFVCVATPPAPDGSVDMSFFQRAVDQIGPHLKTGATIVNKSTVAVGTAVMVERLVNRSDVAIVSNPEFLREGSAVHDSLTPNRIVVGAKDRAAAMGVADLFAATNAPVVITDSTTAEFIKYVANAFLATKLTFINTMDSLCDELGLDVRAVIEGVGRDPRIGLEFLRPGPGWGGSCLPKDAAALVALADSIGVDAEIVRAAIEGNGSRIHHIVNRIRANVGGELDGRTIGVLGLTFKANTDDRRNSPAVAITRELVAYGAAVHAYDPTVSIDGSSSDLAHLRIFHDAYDALNGVDLIAILTEWPEFRLLDFDRIRSHTAGAVIIDPRHLLDRGAIARFGFAVDGGAGGELPNGITAVAGTGANGG